MTEDKKYPDEKLSGAMQENILTMLVFDLEFCTLVRSIVSAGMFESSVYRDVAAVAIDHIDQFKKAIGEHLPDALEGVLQGDDKRKAASYQRVLDNLFLAKDTTDRDYVVSRLHAFVRQQNLKSAVYRAAEAINAGNIDEAEVELAKGMRAQVNVFEMGTSMSDPKAATAFLDDMDGGILTGIKELDKRGCCPRKGELLLFIAPMGKGKSWAMTHFGKWAVLQREAVAHVTLEMSERRTSQRYVQSFLSVTKRQAAVRTPVFVRDELGRLSDIDYEEVSRPSLQDPGIRKMLEARIRKDFKRRAPLIVKQFPTGGLTIAELEAWLDGLERFHKVKPGMLIVDYPDLMKIGADTLRVDTGIIYKELRGIAVRRNVAVVCPTQGNRESMGAKKVRSSMVSEDVSKIATADTVVTYSQTEAECRLGLARLDVAKSRNDEDQFTVLISQAYAMGQFCLDSTVMLSDYWEKIAGSKEE